MLIYSVLLACRYICFGCNSLEMCKILFYKAGTQRIILIGLIPIKYNISILNNKYINK